MTYEKYQEMAFAYQIAGKLPNNFKLWTEKEFTDWMKQQEELSKPTPPLREQRDFVWAYELMYWRLKKMIEKHPEKEKMLKDLEESYQIGSKILGI